jgi:hypothetical protein
MAFDPRGSEEPRLSRAVPSRLRRELVEGFERFERFEGFKRFKGFTGSKVLIE